LATRCTPGKISISLHAPLWRNSSTQNMPRMIKTTRTGNLRRMSPRNGATPI
jgi:hypothetical protein